MPASRPLEVRFWEKVKKCDGEGCWLWIGGKRNGYGQINKGKYHGDKIVMAHRLSWELVKGPIPRGMDVCHRCDNPSCVRIDHLFLGTQYDNTMDCERKGRAVHPKGQEHGAAKLTDEQVQYIRKVYNKRTMNGGHLGRQFGMTRQMITKIVRGDNWRHI